MVLWFMLMLVLCIDDDVDHDETNIGDYAVTVINIIHKNNV